ncbi:hypothetical protein ABIA85_007902 [Bradyrhizobium sp. LA6.10]|uniref:hypothetical protein n=1 Tax=Bradyrhizobium sp. LA6.10 TaxID=3156318 RepID=UPI003398515E
MRRLASRAAEIAGMGLLEVSALEKLQFVKEKHRGLAVGDAAIEGQAPGLRRETIIGADNAFAKFFVVRKICQGDALIMSDRIAISNDLVIQQLAPPAKLYERLQSAFLERFVRENSRLRDRVVA